MADGYLLENGTDKYLLEDGSGVLLIDAPPVLESISADATGTPHQSHLFYAVNSARWWMLFVDPTTPTTLRSAWSTDLVNWTAGATFTLSHSPKLGTSSRYGYNLAVAYKNISSTDVVHISTGFSTGTGRGWDHVRATISGTTISFGTQSTVSTSGNVADAAAGLAVSIDSNNRVQVITNDIATDFGNVWGWRSTNTDSGAAWTAGFDAAVLLYGGPGATSADDALDLGGGVTLALYDDSAGTTETAKNVEFVKSSATGVWSTAGSAAVLAADTTANFSDFDWGAVARTTTDVHVVIRNPDTANAWIHRRYNGTTWAAGAAIPTQASKAGAGVFLCSNGTDVWLFIIDSDAANTVRYCKWSSGAGTWGSWTAFETTTKTRTALSGFRSAANGALGITWTEVDAPFLIVTKPFALPVAYSELARTVTITVSVTETDTVARPVSELVDDFNDGVINTSLWTVLNTPANTTESGGRMRVNPPAVNDYAAVESVSRYRLLDSSCYAKINMFAALHGSSQASFQIKFDNNNYLDFGVFGLNLGYIFNDTGAGGGGSDFATYDPVAHKWLRYRADATTVYLDTSADGITWNNWRTHAVPTWSLGNVKVGFAAGWFTGTDPDPGEMAIVVFNTAVRVPETLGPLAFWYENQSHGPLADAAAMAEWQDHSQNDRHATQANAPERPTNQEAEQNGLDAVRFDGVDDLMIIPASAANFNTGFTAFVAWKPGPYFGVDRLIYGLSAFDATVRWRLYLAGDGTIRVEIYDDDTANMIARKSSLRFSLGVPQVITATYDGGSAASGIKIFFDGYDVSGATYTNGTFVAMSTGGQNLVLGGQAFYGNELEADLYEHGVYPSELSLGNRQALENYLETKWAIPGHLYEWDLPVNIAVTVTAADTLTPGGMHEPNRLVSIAVTVSKTDIQHHQELARPVTIAATVTAPTQVQHHQELNRTVTIAATVTAPTQSQKHNELTRTVTEATTVSIPTQKQTHVETVRTVTAAVTVTATDSISGGVMNETNRLVTIAGTVTAVDVQHYQELARTVNVAATITATTAQAHKELGLTVTAAATITATAVQHLAELSRFVAVAVTATKTDVQAHKEIARLSTTAVTVTATDFLYSSAQEFRTVTLAVTVTAVDIVHRVDSALLVSAAVTVTATAVQHNADLARPVLVTATVSATSLQHMAEARALTILVSVLAIDFYRPQESLLPWHQPAGTITSARPNGAINKVGGGATISDVIPDTTITDRRG